MKQREQASGDILLAAIGAAKESVVVVAPYIKVSALDRIIERLPSHLDFLICVTRWLPGDIAAGVCDLEIMDMIEEFPAGRLLVHPRLHAKYYRADQRCFVGSSNVTERGLGWAPSANLEILLEAESNRLAEWESALIEASLPATLELREHLKAKASALEEPNALPSLPEVGGSAVSVDFNWIPRCPVPERLWSVYNNEGWADMVDASREAAMQDLTHLALPKGLSKAVFETYVADILKQMPFLAEIEHMAAKGLSDSQAHALLSERFIRENAVAQAWRIIKAWLLHFRGQSYRLAVGEEVLVKGRSIGNRR